MWPKFTGFLWTRDINKQGGHCQVMSGNMKNRWNGRGKVTRQGIWERKMKVKEKSGNLFLDYIIKERLFRSRIILAEWSSPWSHPANCKSAGLERNLSKRSTTHTSSLYSSKTSEKFLLIFMNLERYACCLGIRNQSDKKIKKDLKKYQSCSQSLISNWI